MTEHSEGRRRYGMKALTESGDIEDPRLSVLDEEDMPQVAVNDFAAFPCQLWAVPTCVLFIVSEVVFPGPVLFVVDSWDQSHSGTRMMSQGMPCNGRARWPHVWAGN